VEEAPSPAFPEFYRAELGRQVRRAYLMVGSNEVANDVVQEAMVQVYRRWEELENPAAYLSRAVLNGCRDVGRRRSSQRRLLARIAERPSDPEIPDLLDDVLRRLPFTQRAAIVLRFYGGMSTNEIAEAIGCAPGTVGSAIDRGLRKLREALE
jgi:RNA polymerase sigma factor (sigma-70 family)